MQDLAHYYQMVITTLEVAKLLAVLVIMEVLILVDVKHVQLDFIA